MENTTTGDDGEHLWLHRLMELDVTKSDRIAKELQSANAEYDHQQRTDEYADLMVLSRAKSGRCTDLPAVRQRSALSCT